MLFRYDSLVTAVAAVSVSAHVSAQSATDWPAYNRDLAASRYSPLTQINPGKVAKLAVAWPYKMRPDADSPASGTMNQVTPIVVNEVMYLPAGSKLVALDPDTGKEIWRYDLKAGTVASQRGVAYWPGVKDDKNNSPRILFTSGHKMVGLNAPTGMLDPGFGTEGEMTMDVPFAGVPTVFRNLIFVGMNIFGPGGIPGDSRACDARTGKKLWEFHAIPHDREPNASDWAPGSWKGRAGNNSWSYSMDGETRGVMIAALRYIDTFVRMDGAGLFAERKLYVDWLEERALS